MKVEEAKVILAVWRPDGRDHADPGFREALDLARQDERLLQWLHEQQDFDAVMAGTLHAVRGPVCGRDEIMAHARVALAHRAGRRRARLSLAAAILLAAVFGWWRYLMLLEPVLPAQPFTVASAAEHLSMNHKSMEFYAEDPSELQGWLLDRGSPVPERLPGRLAALRGYGCQDWRTSRGRLSLLCFYPEGSTGSGGYGTGSGWVHFFVFPGTFADLPDATPTPQLVEGGQWVFLVWRDGDSTYALGLPAKPGAAARLRQIIGA